MTNTQLDHIGFWCLDVDEAAASLVQDWDLESVQGGRHEGEGTHNRLIGAHDQTYVELIGPDPSQTARGPFRKLGDTLGDLAPCLAAYRHPDLDEAASQGLAAGLKTAGPRSMQRTASDGSSLSWRVLFFEDESEPFFPFLIDWGTSPHPSASLKPVSNVQAISWATPEPAAFNRKLHALGIAALAHQSEERGLRIALETPNGMLKTGG